MLETLREFAEKREISYPEIIYSTLYKKVFNNLYYEFCSNNEKFLYSPYYIPLRGDAPANLSEFISQNESFFDTMKGFIVNSLFVYTSIVDENSYFMTNSPGIMITRMIHYEDGKFELKFYSHYEDEVMKTYKDKIYIGRDFINLEKFQREYLGLKDLFLSLGDQSNKMLERAKQKLRYYDDYESPFLKEIKYLTQELVSESLEQIKIMPEFTLREIPRNKANVVLESLIYLQNLMIELRDFSIEFENKLRLREETNFVKYLTKYSKDLKNDIRYLRKLSSFLHLKVSNYAIC